MQCSRSALVATEGSGTVVPLAAILSGVNADARPTAATSGATEAVKLTGAASDAIVPGQRLA